MRKTSGDPVPSRWPHVAALITYLVLLAAHVLAHFLPLGGVTTGAIAPMYPSLILPADLTFWMWAVILFLQGLFVLAPFDVFGTTCRVQKDLARHATAPFMLFAVCNVLWLVTWHHRHLAGATGLAAAMYGCAIWGYRVMERHQSVMRLSDKIFIRAAFRVMTAWMSLATIVHFSMLMTAWSRNGWGGISEPTWALVLLVTALLATLVVTLAAQDAVFGMVALWTYMGILLRHLSTGAGGLSGRYGSLVVCLTICLVLQFTAVMLAIHRSRRRAGKSPEADFFT